MKASSQKNALFKSSGLKKKIFWMKAAVFLTLLIYKVMKVFLSIKVKALFAEPDLCAIDIQKEPAKPVKAVMTPVHKIILNKH